VKHTKPVEGLWAVSISALERDWRDDAFFDSKNEAVEHARSLCSHNFFVGRVRPLTEHVVAKTCIDMLHPDYIDEQLAQHDWASEDAMLNTVSDRAAAELTEYIEGWLTRHRIVRLWFEVDDAEKIVWSGR